MLVYCSPSTIPDFKQGHFEAIFEDLKQDGVEEYLINYIRCLLIARGASKVAYLFGCYSTLYMTWWILNTKQKGKHNKNNNATHIHNTQAFTVRRELINFKKVMFHMANHFEAMEAGGQWSVVCV